MQPNNIEELLKQLSMKWKSFLENCTNFLKHLELEKVKSSEQKQDKKQPEKKPEENSENKNKVPQSPLKM
jgi:hypothetical protein